jgi:hypothetical protein
VFLIVDRIIDDVVVEVLRKSFSDLFHGRFESGITPDEVNWQYDSGDPGLKRQIRNGWKSNRAIASTVTRANLGQTIANLSGWLGTRLMIDNIV